MSTSKVLDETTLLGYRERFVLSIVNLVRNAKEAGASLVQVSAFMDLNELVLSVDDDGSGVPAEHREAIFRLGFSLRPGGSGQGLARVREIITEDHRGMIVCETSPNGAHVLSCVCRPVMR